MLVHDISAAALDMWGRVLPYTPLAAVIDYMRAHMPAASHKQAQLAVGIKNGQLIIHFVVAAGYDLNNIGELFKDTLAEVQIKLGENGFFSPARTYNYAGTYNIFTPELQRFGTQAMGLYAVLALANHKPEMTATAAYDGPVVWPEHFFAQLDYIDADYIRKISGIKNPLAIIQKAGSQQAARAADCQLDHAFGHYLRLLQSRNSRPDIHWRPEDMQAILDKYMGGVNRLMQAPIAPAARPQAGQESAPLLESANRLLG